MPDAVFPPSATKTHALSALHKETDSWELGWAGSTLLPALAYFFLLHLRHRSTIGLEIGVVDLLAIQVHVWRDQVESRGAGGEFKRYAKRCPAGTLETPPFPV